MPYKTKQTGLLSGRYFITNMGYLILEMYKGDRYLFVFLMSIILHR